MKSYPVSQEGVAGYLFEGEVCPQHELWWRYVRLGGRGGMED